MIRGSFSSPRPALHRPYVHVRNLCDREELPPSRPGAASCHSRPVRFVDSYAHPLEKTARDVSLIRIATISISGAVHRPMAATDADEPCVFLATRP